MRCPRKHSKAKFLPQLISEFPDPILISDQMVCSVIETVCSVIKATEPNLIASIIKHFVRLSRQNKCLDNQTKYSEVCLVIKATEPNTICFDNRTFCSAKRCSVIEVFCYWNQVFRVSITERSVIEVHTTIFALFLGESHWVVG